MTDTGTDDVAYNLVSVLYHALQGAENYPIYARDAEEEGDEEAARFFEKLRHLFVAHADEAKALLARRLS